MSDGPDEKEPAPEAKFPDPPSDAEIQERLAASKARLEESKTKYDEIRSEPEPGSSHSAAVAMSIAYAILILPTVGGGAGWFIDQQVGGTLSPCSACWPGGSALWCMRCAR